MLSEISSTVACIVSMPPWRSGRRRSVHSGLNDPPDRVVVSRFVDAVEAGADPAVEGGTGVGQDLYDPSDGRAQGPSHVQTGPLGGRRRPPVATAEAEGA